MGEIASFRETVCTGHWTGKKGIDASWGGLEGEEADSVS